MSSNRLRELIPDGPIFIELGNFEDTFRLIDGLSGRVVILLSGDPCLFSLLPLVKAHYPDKITVLPGISSLQVLCARVSESWSGSKILSGHGRTLRPGKFLNIVERNKTVILFCDATNSPKWACENLKAISGNLEIFIGECLGSPNERILRGRPCDFDGEEFSGLSVMMIRNHDVYIPKTIYPRDCDFIRSEGIVMTNENIRSVIMSKLRLNNEAVFWDIGAGTGSISVCAGLAFPDCEIHTIDYKPDAVRVIALNSSRYHLHNISIHEARALSVIDELPSPSHVFIGGTEGELEGIINRLSGHEVRVVIACVTFETFTRAYELLKGWQNFEAVQISVSTSQALKPNMTMMKASNPVMIFCAENKLKFS